MTTGAFIQGSHNDYFLVPGIASAATGAASVAPGPRGLYDPDPAPTGARLDSQPIAAGTAGARIGGVLCSYSDDFHNTIHVRPIFLHVGSVVNGTTRFVEVWNGYIEDSKTLDSLTVTNGDGITVTGVTLPYTFAPLASATFQIDVSSDGPATVDARYDLVFTTAEGSPFFRVLGRRVYEWLEPPNWSNGYEETLTYRTEVLTAFDGNEQRIALRHRPRRAIGYAALVDRDRDRRLRRWLATWQPRFFVMADWARGVRSDGAPVGGTTLVLDEPAPEITAGTLAVLRHGDLSQSIEVASVDGNIITLQAPVSVEFPVGTKVYPGLTVRAEAEVGGRRHTATVGELALTFTLAHEAATLTPAAATETWRGEEVFLTKPNWGDVLDHDHRYASARLDAGRGAFEYRFPEDSPKDVRKLAFLFDDRDDVRDIEAFFHRCRGRRGEFFMPTWDSDLVLPDGGQLLSGSTQFPLADSEDVNRPDLDLVYRNICVRLRDGTRLYRQVISGVTGPSGPYYTVDAPWPTTIAASDILVIHYMPRWRLASDDLTINWHTDGTAEVSLAMQTLEDA